MQVDFANVIYYSIEHMLSVLKHLTYRVTSRKQLVC